MAIEIKKAKQKKYPLFGNFISLRNLKLKISDLPADLEARIESWKSRKGKGYIYDETTDFGKECLLISNDLRTWIDAYVHEKAVGNLKLQDVSLTGDNDLTKIPEASENKEIETNKETIIEITEGRDSDLELNLSPPQVLSTVETIAITDKKEENKEPKEKATDEAKEKTVKTILTTENKTITQPQKIAKPITKKANQNPIETQSKQPQKLADIELILEKLYKEGFRELKNSDLKKYSIPLSSPNSYTGELYNLSFCFWSWNYTYTITKNIK